MISKVSLCLSSQVKYWRHDDKEENARKIRTFGNQTSTKITNLQGSALYHLAVKAYNTAGTGPSSATVNVTTRKPRKRRRVSGIPQGHPRPLPVPASRRSSVCRWRRCAGSGSLSVLGAFGHRAEFGGWEMRLLSSQGRPLRLAPSVRRPTESFSFLLFYSLPVFLLYYF